MEETKKTYFDHCLMLTLKSAKVDINMEEAKETFCDHCFKFTMKETKVESDRIICNSMIGNSHSGGGSGTKEDSMEEQLVVDKETGLDV